MDMSHSTGSQALGFSFSFGLFFAIKKELFKMLEKRKLQVKNSVNYTGGRRRGTFLARKRKLETLGAYHESSLPYLRL